MGLWKDADQPQFKDAVYNGLVVPLSYYPKVSLHPPKPLTPKQAPAGKNISSEIVKLFPALKTVRKVCPQCIKGVSKGMIHETGVAPLENIIIHLNDKHQWTREQIADWLEVISMDDDSIDLTIKEDANGTAAA